MDTPVDVAVLNNRYQILNLIGTGGMGKVYQALDRLTGDHVAIKRVLTRDTILRSASEDATFRVALAQEFRTVASLRHPYIISVLDYGFDASETSQRQPFFVMEYLEDRQTIVEYSAGQPLQTKLEILIQALEALRYLHHRGVIHRDLKPDNIVVTGDHVKVLDFGLAIVRRPQTPMVEEESISGTVAYMAPEVLKGMSATEVSDLYALGVIAYQVLTGVFPYKSEAIGPLINEIIFKHPDIVVIEEALRREHVDPQTIAKLQVMIARLLEKDPAERYQQVSDVLAPFYRLTGEAERSENSAVRESFLQAAQLVGRDAEMALLTTTLKAAENGAGATWLVGGESGIGKSRLLDELRILALVDGIVVLQGGAVAEGGAPYQVWRNVIRRLILQTELSELEASILKPIIPDISRLLSQDVPDVPDIGAVASFNRLVVTITNLFIRQQTPLLVLLEDLQWSPESVEILKKLAPQVSRQHLLLIGAYRSDELPNLPHEIPEARVLQLTRLPPQAVADLSAAMVGERGRTQQVLELLADQTDGNVLFIIEVMRALVEESGRIENIGQNVPASLFGGGVQKVIAHRLNRLPPELHPLLRTAAVQGKVIDLKVIQRLFPADQIERWLQVSSDANLLTVQEDQWRFTHDKIRETLLAALPPDDSRMLHRQVAEAVQSVYGAAAYASRLAYYWENAGDAAQEGHYRQLAGSQAAKNGAFAEAVKHLERLLLLYKQGLPSEAVDRARAKHQLSIAYFELGRMNDAREFSLGAIAEVASPVPESQRGLILGMLRETAIQIGHRLTHYSHTETSPARGEILRQCAECLFQISESSAYVGNGLLGGYASFRGMNLIEQYGPSPQLAYSFAGVGWFTSTQGRWSISRVYLSLAEKVAQQTNDPRVTTAKFPLAIAYIGQGMWQEAWKHAEECIEGANQTGDWRNWRQATGLKGDVLYFTGKYDEMLKLYVEGYAQAKRGQDISQMAIQKAIRARALHVMGRYDEAQRIAQEAIALENPSTMTVFNAQPVFILESIRLGKLDDLKLHADQLMTALRKNDLVIYVTLDGYAANALGWLHLLEQKRATPAQAEEACKLLQHYAKIYPIGQPRALIFDGWRMFLSGDSARAIRSIEQGLQKAAALGMPYDEGLANLYLGRIQPTPAQRDRYFAHAHEIFTRIGAHSALDELARAKS